MNLTPPSKPSKQHHSNLRGIKARNVFADKLLDSGLKGLNDTEHVRPSIEAFIFDAGNENYQQAVECFRHGLYDAAMVMARATLDAALYESKYTILDKVTRDGGIYSHHTSKGLRGEGSWHILSAEARELGMNAKQETKLKVIWDEYGSFSAHNAQRRIEGMINASKGLHRQIFATEESAAYEILKQTCELLVFIRKAFVKRGVKTMLWFPE